MAISQKSCSGCSGGSIFHNRRVQIAKKNRPKIDHKTEHKMECTLAWIIIGFWLVSVCKFGWNNRFKTDIGKHQKLGCFWQEARSGQEVKEFSHSLVRGIPRTQDPGFRAGLEICLLYTSPSPRDATLSRMPSSA